MTDPATVAYIVQRRRECQRQEADEHTRLTELLNELVDPRTTFWTSLENKPRSMISGLLQKARGVRSGMPDVLVVYRRRSGCKIIFVELKSRSGKASKEQKQVRLEMLQVGIDWWMVRSARAALVALHRSGVKFRRWKRFKLASWEGPFADPTQRLPMAPDVAARLKIARWRWQANYKARRAALAAGQGNQTSTSPTNQTNNQKSNPSQRANAPTARRIRRGAPTVAQLARRTIRANDRIPSRGVSRKATVSSDSL
jgi:hypothetical protein